jgi:Xaa-Pro aminopeptidase
VYRDSINSHEDAKVLAPEKALQFGAEYEGEYYPDVLMEYDSPWKVHAGRPIIFEVWGTYKDYAFDYSRTVHVGEPSPEYLDLCTKFLGAWREGIEAELRPGISTHDLFEKADALVEQTGIPTPKKTLPFFHSIGLDIIEQPNGYPSLGRLKSWELEENVVMNCELLYFGHTVAPYHIESTFLITSDGAELLQTMPEDLQVLA